MMKRIGFRLLCRLCCLLLTMLLLLQALAPMACAEERKTVRVGFFAFDGYHMMDENGERSGYGYDFLRMAARYMNVDYEYVGYENGWNEMLDMLRDGRIDLLTSAQITRERMSEFAFSKSIGSSTAMLTVSTENHTLEAGRYSEYDGIRIGLLKKNSRNADLQEFAKLHNFSYSPVFFELATDLEEALQNGQIDAACTSSLRETQNERVLDTFNTRNFYVIVRKEDKELLENINYAIDQLDAAEGDWRNELNNRYYEHLEEKNLTFTERERALIDAYVSGEKTLIVTGSMDRAPYTYVEDGQLKGIIVDYFAKLAEYIGIPYELAVPTSREEYQSWQKNGPPSVFMDSRITSEGWVEENSFAYSRPYTTMRLAMVTRRDFDGQIEKLAVASAQGEFGIEEGIAPNAERVEVSTRTEAMQAVMHGEADAAIVYLYTAQQFVNQDVRGLLSYSLLESPTYEYHVGFTHSVSHELAGIFTKAIYALDDGLFEEIAADYTSYKAQDMDLITWISIYPILAVIICTCFFLICTLAIVVFMRHRAIDLEKKRTAELHSLAKQAERANRAKSDFLANVSHDIRTPMNAIIGFANLMEHQQDNPEQLREYTRKIKQSGRHLLSLIDDVLDMSRIEADQIRLLPAPMSLTEQIRQVEDITRVTTAQRKQTFNVSIRALEHDAVISDSARLRQVLLNLLSNAVKYTPVGGNVELSLEELPCERADYGKFRFTVSDNGRGITPELQMRIFEPFARGEASVTNKIQGSGLGMAITKNIVNRLDGKIIVESTVGKGSRFEVTLTLPIDSADDVKIESKENHSALFGKRFLCAEDNAINAEILEEILRLYGAQCTIYPDGAKLVAAFETISPGEYDAILMDVQMPNMNGLEATRAIRSGKNPLGRSIPIIAMTANAFVENVRQNLEAGMNAHISKPISIDVLEKTVEELCNSDKNEP